MGAWAARHDRSERTKLLQDAGIRAGAVQNAEDLNETDPQLEHRGVFFEMDRPVIAVARFAGVPIHLSDASADHWRSGPLLGEADGSAFTQLLGLDDHEFAGLAVAGVI